MKAGTREQEDATRGKTQPPLAQPEQLSATLATIPDVLFAADAVLSASDSAPPEEPLAGFFLRACHVFGHPRDPARQLSFWESRTPGNLRSATRYRWELSHRIGVPIPAYAGSAGEWADWQARDRGEADPFEVEERLLLPIILSENAELILELCDHEQLGEAARKLLAETAPLLRRDFARHVQMLDPWADTFALWCISRQAGTLALIHPIAIAITACYAAECSGPVLGIRYPFHQKPLVSASAHLASALMTLGTDLELAATLSEFVRKAQRDSGGWGDANESEDVLTTLVAAELLSRMDPSFDPAPTIAYFASAQGTDGMWRVLGPEAPWLTHQIVLWAAGAQRPFGERFRWPHRAQAIRDHKTGLPFFGYFVELAQVFEAAPGLGSQWIELGFLDLIGFRAFNNRFGQSAGDDVLSLLSRHLEQIPAARAIRDGGDEFLIVGAPASATLTASLETFRETWPALFAKTFGADVPPVAARIIVGRVRASELRRARELLGQRITDLKTLISIDPIKGVLIDAGPL